MKKLFNIREVFLLIILFIYIYSPPLKVIPVGTIKLLSFACIIGLLFQFKSSTIKVLSYKYLVYSVLLYGGAVFYSFAKDYLFYNPYAVNLSGSFFYKQSLIVAEVLPIALFITLYVRKKLKFTLFDLLFSFIKISIIQSFICLIMFLFPKIKLYIFTSLMDYDEAADKLLETGNYYDNYRGFGLSIGHLFSLPVFQGMAIAFLILLCIYNFSKYFYLLFFIPLLALSIGLNARIGFVIIPIFAFIALLVYFRRFKLLTIVRSFFVFGVIALIIYLFLTNVYGVSELSNNINWIFKAYTQSRDFIEGSGQEGTLYILTTRHIHFSDSLSERIFGEGRYVFGETTSSKAISSDIGYIRDIYFGGYIYSGLLYASFIMLFWSAYRFQKELLSRILLYFLLLTIAVVHLKGDIFSSNPGYRAAFIIFVFVVVDRYANRQEARKIRQLQINNPVLYTGNK